MNDPTTNTTANTEDSNNDDQSPLPQQSASDNNELPQPSESGYESSHTPSEAENLGKPEPEHPRETQDSTPKSDAATDTVTTEENPAKTETTKKTPKKPKKPKKPRTKSIDAAKPPLLPLVIAAILLCVSLWLFTNPISPVNVSWLWLLDRLNSNSFGYVLGSFSSILPLTVFLRSNARKRATMNYKEWQTVSSQNLILWATGANWFCGAIHLFFWMTELVTA